MSPWAPAKPCAEFGCHRLTTNSRCDEHKRTPFARRRTPNNRPTSGWQNEQFRRVVLARAHYRCERCGARATVADHITPLSKGGAHDTANGQALCRICHSKKTGSDAR